MFDLSKFFTAIILLFGLSQLFGFLFNKFKLPKVVGEILGGIILGPTFLAEFFPLQYNDIFTNQLQYINVFYWFGLILLMFCSGFEVDANFNKKQDLKTIICITFTSTLIPFISGWVITSFIDLLSIIGTANNITALRIVISIAIAVTSIPVISKILFDLKIINTSFAKIVIGTATFHDIILWIFLAVATTLVSNKTISAFTIASHVIITILFFGVTFFILPKLISYFKPYFKKIVPGNYEMVIIFIVLLMFVILSENLSINIVFGAFLAGIVFGFFKQNIFKDSLKSIKDFSFAFPIPLYFAMVGLNLNLLHGFNIIFFIKFLIIAILIQGITVFITAKLLNYDFISSINLSIAMNARGGPGIVLATVSYEIGIINQNLFASIVLLSIVTSLLAGAWLRYVVDKKMTLLQKV